MLKYYVLVFLFNSTADLKMTAFQEVQTLDQCVETVAFINASRMNENAACFIKKEFPDS